MGRDVRASHCRQGQRGRSDGESVWADTAPGREHKGTEEKAPRKSRKPRHLLFFLASRSLPHAVFLRRPPPLATGVTLGKRQTGGGGKPSRTEPGRRHWWVTPIPDQAPSRSTIKTSFLYDRLDRTPLRSRRRRIVGANRRSTDDSVRAPADDPVNRHRRSHSINRGDSNIFHVSELGTGLAT